VRALGFSHVIAGPGLGRGLAYHGADVLNLWTPNDFEMDFNYYSAHVGMRSAIMDFSRLDEMSRFRRLASVSDDHPLVLPRKPASSGARWPISCGRVSPSSQR
jgi:crotonobetainyl-CoA:carnitine CoA-transferase CaiB-like acyl-CoA transferase